MRKTSYFIAFVATLFTLTLNIVSIIQPSWLRVHPPDFLGTRTVIHYGLFERCELQQVHVPGGGSNGRIDYTNYSCRAFPQQKLDGCEDEYRTACTLWLSAAYIAVVSAVPGVAAALGLVFGVTTHSRRRRVWRAVVALVGWHAMFKILTFSIVTHLYQIDAFPLFEYARPSTAYILNTVSWILDVFIVVGIIVTGLSADAGHVWAAGNRAYRPIPTQG